MRFITVHGTGDGARESNDGEVQWWRAESSFCQELITAAPLGSSIEPFTWSGSNDEGERRRAGEELLRHVRRSGASGDHIHLIGHSHGGSVIAAALRYAAAERRRLPRVVAITSIGTPFLSLRHKALPWDRFGAVGQAALTFAAISAVLTLFALFDIARTAIYPDAETLLGFFVYYVLLGGAAVFALCALILRRLSRQRRGHHGKGAYERCRRFFEDRWLAIASSGDEAIGGLSRLTALRARLFSHSVLNPLASVLTQVAYLSFIATWWWLLFFGGSGYDYTAAVGTPYEGSSFFQQPNVSLHHAVGPLLRPVVWLHAQWVETLRHLFFDAVLTGGDYAPGMVAEITLAVLFGIALVAGYFMVMVVLLRAVQWLSEHTIGAGASAALNQSALKAALSVGYGAGPVRENPAGVSAAPFGKEVERLPAEIDERVIAFAEQNVAATYRGVHKTLFELGHSGDETSSLAEAALRHVTWSELVHTGYFRVPECRRHLVERIVERSATDMPTEA